MPEKSVTITEFWNKTGCYGVQMFDSKGRDITAKPAVSDFLRFYLNRLNKTPPPFVAMDFFGEGNLAQTTRYRADKA